MTPSTGLRLPTDLIPTHYDLTIRTDLEKLEFHGFVRIRYVLGILRPKTHTQTRTD